MAESPRLNLDLLRRFRKVDVSAQSHGPLLSRRTFLGLAGATAAAGAFSVFPSSDGFSILREGDTLHVEAEDHQRWTIDPSVFGPRARVTLERTRTRIGIALRHAFFPGTDLPADFDCILSSAEGPWSLELVSRCGIELKCDLLDWLCRRTLATGVWRSSGLPMFEGFQLRSSKEAPVAFAPDWRFEVDGRPVARLYGLDGDLPIDTWQLNIDGGEQIAGGPSAHRTNILMRRGDTSWPVNLSRRSPSGWSVEAEGETFDELRVEAMHRGGATLRTALLTQSERTVAQLHLLPGGGLLDHGQKPFRLSLENPRLAFSIDNASATHTALVAAVSSTPVWAHTADMSLLLSGNPDSPLFELIESSDAANDDTCCGPKVAPQVFELNIDSATDVNMRMKFNQKRPLHWNWATAIQPVERLLGMMHLTFWEHHLAFDLTCDDRLHILRSRDQLNLIFAFQNMRLHSGGFDPKIKHRKSTKGKTPKSEPYLCCAATGGDPTVTVLFPPQHISEQAFFRQDPNDTPLDLNVGDVELKRILKTPGSEISIVLTKHDLDPDVPPPAGEKFPQDVPAQSRMSGPTQLVYTIPAGVVIPFSLEHLLDWGTWKPAVAAVASSQPDENAPITQPSLYSDPNPDATPATPATMSNLVTAIELPYRLFLSPSELGGWAHSTEPVDHETGVFELWHSRLGLHHDNLPVDESAAAAITARAIWANEFVEGGKEKAAFPQHENLPYRTSLDGRDRCEIVHLTSNYKLKEQGPITTPDTRANAAKPLQIDRLMLTPHGGYLQSLGTWNPPQVEETRDYLTVERWQHNATLGRDHEVRVDYKGFLMPFGFKASFVKVTQRYFDAPPDTPKDCIAYLHQRMYIVVKDPNIYFPILGQKYAGREIGLDHIELLTPKTPSLFDPTKQTRYDGKTGNQTQSLFWPSLDGVTPFEFAVRFWYGKEYADSMVKFTFAGSDVVQDTSKAAEAIAFYNSGKGPVPPNELNLTESAFFDQKLAFAPSAKPGDTSYDVTSIQWRADGLDESTGVKAEELYQHDIPLFYPAIDNARISSSAVKRVATGATSTAQTTGTDPSQITRVSFYPKYLERGFDPKANRGEVFLNVIENPVPLQFGKNNAADQSGGLASADTLVVGFARQSGPVGGLRGDVNSALQAKVVLQQARATRKSFAMLAANTVTSSSLDVHAQGHFDAASFFGGLASAKILGGIKLSDIIAPFLSGVASNLGDAPKMLEQMLFDDISPFEQDIVNIINAIQTATIPNPTANFINPLARALAPQAEAVNDSYALVQGSSSDSIEKAVRQAGFINCVIQYADALKAKLENPAALAEQALMDTLQSTIKDPLQTFESQILGVAETLLKKVKDSLQRPNNFDQLLTDATTTLAELGAAATQEVTNYLADSANDLVVTMPFRELVPELLSYADLAPVAGDLVSRLRAVSNISSIGITGTSLFLQNINPILDDLFTLAERLGFIDAGSKTTVQNAIRDVEIQAIQLFEKIDFDRAKVTPYLDDLNDSCIIFAASLPTEQGRAVLQNLRQIQRAVERVQKIPASIPAVAPGSQLKATQWAVTQLQRKAQQQILESIIALRTSANTTLATATGDLQTSAFDLLSKCDPLPRLLTIVANLLPPNPILTLSTLPDELYESLQESLDDMQQRIADLRTQIKLVQASIQTLQDQIQTLQTQIASTTDATAKQKLQKKLDDLQLQQAPLQLQLNSLQLQLYKMALDYQAPFAAVHGLQLCVSGVLAPPAAVASALQSIQTNLGSISIELAAFANVAKGALDELLASATGAWTALDSVLSPTPNSNMALQILAEVITVAEAAVTDYKSAKRVTSILYKSHRLIAAYTNLLAKIREQMLNVKNDVVLLQQASQQLPKLLKRIPQAAKIKLSYDWHPKLKNYEPVFLLREGADFEIRAASVIPLLGGEQPTYNITATLSKFSINLIGTPSFVIVDIDKLTFTSANGASPNCDLKIDSVRFGQDMSFVQELASLLDPSEGPFLEFAPGMVYAGFRFQVPTIHVGAFTMMQLRLEVSIGLPFNGDPVRCLFGISDQQNPFLLSAGIYGGGGYLQLKLGLDGVERLEGALEFGLVSNISIGPLKGYGYIVAGIYFRIAGNDSCVGGFVHAHGHMDVLGIIAMTIDLQVMVIYQSGGNVHGEADFMVDIEILFFSASYTFHASYDFAGKAGSSNSQGLTDRDRAHHVLNAARSAEPSPAPNPLAYRIDRKRWAEYFDCFAI